VEEIKVTEKNQYSINIKRRHYIMSAKRITGFVMGLVAFGLQIPGMLMVLSSPGGWNFASVLLAVLILATVVFAIIAALFSINGRKRAPAMFICGGIGGVLALALTVFMLTSIELIVITGALSAIVLFVSAKVVSTRAVAVNP
jgi:hypothetical protein